MGEPVVARVVLLCWFLTLKVYQLAKQLVTLMDCIQISKILVVVFYRCIYTI